MRWVQIAYSPKKGETGRILEMDDIEARDKAREGRVRFLDDDEITEHLAELDAKERQAAERKAAQEHQAAKEADQPPATDGETPNPVMAADAGENGYPDDGQVPQTAATVEQEPVADKPARRGGKAKNDAE